MRLRTIVAGVVVAAVAGGAVAAYDLVHQATVLLTPDQCTASVEGHTVSLDPEQAQNAALISAIAVRRGMPARAASIALATALQESKLYNLESGDRDSVGLFQQRPSQGWGTRAEILNPFYATNRFYDALAQVPGYTTMAITDAAQQVQHSGYPQAYAAHEADARALASALTGESPHAFSCQLHAVQVGGAHRVLANGLTHRADVARRLVEAGFGNQTARPASSDGRSFDIAIADRVHGWAIAQYLVALAQRLDLASVGYDGRTWTTGDHSGDGWASDSGTTAHAVHVVVQG